MQPGERLGDYTILTKIGEGGMSIVYLAQQAGKNVVVKQLKDEHRFNEQLVQRFKLEAEILQNLRHPHLARLFDLIEHDGKLYIVQEYLAGGSLADLLRNGAEYSEKEAIGWCRDALRAMNYAHENRIVHRDLKPNNLMLDASRKVRVIDFGIARAFGERRITRASDPSMGTLEYMSPEQITEPHKVDHLTDVYSMGIVLFELLSGAVPFDGPTPFAVQEKIIRQPMPPLRQLGSSVAPISPGTRAVDAELTRIILLATEKERAHRFGGCAEFALALEKYLLRRTGTTGDPPWWRSPGTVAAACVLLLLTAAGVWATLQWDPPRPDPPVIEDDTVARRQQEAAAAAEARRRDEERRQREADALAAQQRRDEEAATQKREADALAAQQRRDEEAARQKREADALTAQQRRDEEAARQKRQADGLAAQQRRDDEAAKLKRETDAAAERKRLDDAAKLKQEADASAETKRLEGEAAKLKQERLEAAELKRRQEAATRQKQAADAAAEKKRLDDEAARLRQEAAAAEKRRLDDEAATLNQEAAAAERRRLAEAARLKQAEAAAAARFFAAVQGRWEHEVDDRGDDSRTRTQNALQIEDGCVGVLTRTIVTYKRTFAGWDRTGTQSTQFKFTCDGLGRLTGQLGGQITPRGPTLLLDNLVFSRAK